MMMDPSAVFPRCRVGATMASANSAMEVGEAEGETTHESPEDQRRQSIEALTSRLSTRRATILHPFDVAVDATATDNLLIINPAPRLRRFSHVRRQAARVVRLLI
jgi:hypothetical protein